ncbi:MAG: MFS transporter, partial [Spirochaetia bacterium]|nr:MFS transporter [Spirochaetia bacterium]
YRTLGGLQLLLVLVLFFSRSLWQDSSKKTVKEHLAQKEKPSLKNKALPFALFSFFLYCSLEISTGLWAVSYLVEVKHLIPTDAAFYGSLFFLGITSGRMASGFVSYRLSNYLLIVLGLLIAFLSIIMLYFAPLSIAGFSLLVLGIGCAPIFPSLIHETPRSFGPENSSRIIGLQMASAYVGSTITPPLFGILGTLLGMYWMPLMQMVILLLMVLCIGILIGFTRRNRR